MYFECPKPSGGTPACNVHCETAMDTIYDEVKELMDYIDNDGSEMVFLGYYRYKKNGSFDWYNDCVDSIAADAAAEQDFPDSLHYVFTEDWVDDPNYYLYTTYYTDGLHPSHYTVDLIADEIVTIIDALD